MSLIEFGAIAAPLASLSLLAGYVLGLRHGYRRGKTRPQGEE